MALIKDNNIKTANFMSGTKNSPFRMKWNQKLTVSYETEP